MECVLLANQALRCVMLLSGKFLNSLRSVLLRWAKIAIRSNWVVRDQVNWLLSGIPEGVEHLHQKSWVQVNM